MTDSMNIENELNHALQLHRAGQLDDAAVVYRRIVDNNPDNSDACYGLGTVLMQQHRNSAAAELLKQAVQQGPDVPEFVFNHACAIEQLGQTEEAVKGFLRAAELVATDAAMLPTICQKLLDAGMPDAALRFLSRIPVPGVLALTVRANGQAAKGDFGGAALALKQAVGLEPKNADTWRTLARAYGQLRDYAAAIHAYDTYMELKTPDASDLLAYADLLLLARQPDAAQQALDLAVAAGCNQPTLHYMSAKCARLHGNYENARKHLQQAIKLKPAFGDAWQMLLETEQEQSLALFAVKCGKLAEDENNSTRDRIVLYLTAGRALERLEQYPQAFQHFRAGKNLQKADQDDRDLRYDNVAFERLAIRVRTEFDVPGRVASENDPEKQPIFILGMPRSGTTVVERILGELDGVVTGGENESLEFITKQYYWDLERGRVSSPRDLRSAAWDRLASEYWRRTSISPCRITDKMPHNIWHVGFIFAMFPAAPVIYLRRDPRDVCLSIYSRMFPDGHRYATELNSLAQYLAISVQMMEHWKTLYEGRILVLDYEDLIADPKKQTIALASHCGLEWRPECLDFHERVVASYTFSEIQVREPLNDKGIGKWRRYGNELTPLIEALGQAGILPDEH